MLDNFFQKYMIFVSACVYINIFVAGRLISVMMKDHCKLNHQNPTQLYSHIYLYLYEHKLSPCIEEKETTEYR